MFEKEIKNKCSTLCVDQVLNEIDEQGIKIYELPDCESDEDEEYVEQTKQLKVLNNKLFLIKLDAKNTKISNYSEKHLANLKCP